MDKYATKEDNASHDSNAKADVNQDVKNNKVG